MHKRYSLTAIVNHLSEDQLAGMPPDDVLTLLEGLHFQAPHPAVSAARERVLNAMLRCRAPGSTHAARRRRLH